MISYEMSLYPTAVTPMQENGSIDYPALEKLFSYYAKAGCDGVFAVCQSSEMFKLTEDEKIGLADRSIKLCRKLGIKCVISGHTQDALEDQITYLKQVEKLEADALILVSNRLALETEDDDTLIANLTKILDSLDPQTRLGIYECPYPYKRLLTSKVIGAMLASGRFDFIKDTCCNQAMLSERLAQIKNSTIRLYNANSATLNDSTMAGGAGYSGVQLNFTPELFFHLKAALRADPPRMKKARTLLSHISAIAVIELQNYPANAKYCLMKKGILSTAAVRNSIKPLTPSQMLELDAYLEGEADYAHRLLPRVDPLIIFEPGRHFAQCHASTILPLANGETITAYFAGTREGNDDVGIWLSRREKGAWQAPELIFKVDDTAHWNPVLFQTSEGIRIYFKTGRKIASWKSHTALSIDGGRTWSEATALTGKDAASGPVRSKPIRLSGGEWLAPDSDETVDVWLPRVDVSHDEGLSFQRLADIPINVDRPDEANYICGKGAIQPTLWESENNCVHALLRTTCGRIYRSDSPDSGRTWCQAYDTGMPNNNSGIDIVRFGEALYLILNPVAESWGPRTPLTVMKSKDNGLNFEHFATVADQPFDSVTGDTAEFSYPAITHDGNSLQVSFTWKRRAIACVRIPI